MNKRFKECLLDVYHAEQTGEVIFESMLRYAQNKEERFILGSMLQLETEAKAIMRPSLVQLELPIEEEKLSREQGLKYAKQFDHIFPHESLNNYLNYFDMKEADFFEVLEKFRNKEIFMKNNNEWNLNE